MNRKALAFVQRHKLLSKGDNVLVAVSGGADSMALLHFLMEERKALGIGELAAFHLNHNLRESAHQDARLVADFCKAHAIPCHVQSVDIGQLAAKSKRGIEETARQVRYQLLGKVAADMQGKIATAHHANDNLETALFHFVRGVSLKGLCAIPAQNGNVIRPLLSVQKEEIESYCATYQLPVAVDHTNFLPLYTRNKLRLEVLPKLLEINENLVENFSQRVERLKEEEDFLQNCAQRCYNQLISEKGLSLAPLRKEHLAIQSRVIKLFLQRNQVDVNHGQIASLRKAIGRKEAVRLQIGKGRWLVADGQTLSLEKKMAKPSFEGYRLPVKHGQTMENEIFSMAVAIMDKKEYEKK